MTNKERIIAGLLRDLGAGFRETERYWQHELTRIKVIPDLRERNKAFKQLKDITKDAEDGLVADYFRRYEELEKRHWR